MIDPFTLIQLMDSRLRLRRALLPREAVAEWSGVAVRPPAAVRSRAGVWGERARAALPSYLVDLLEVPVAGVGDDDVRRIGNAGAGQLAARRGEHRGEVPEVRGGGHDLGGNDQVA